MQYADSGNLEGVEDDVLTEILGWASPEQRLRGLPAEERLRGLPLEERLAGLNDEEAARLRELLEQRRAQ